MGESVGGCGLSMRVRASAGTSDGDSDITVMEQSDSLCN